MPDLSEGHEPERRQRELLEKLYGQTGLSVFEMFRNFPVFTPRFNLARFLAHYELFKKAVSLPGAIVDLGVYRGASTFTWAKLCEIFCPTDVKKVVYGFDTFEGFPALSPEDGPGDPAREIAAGGYHGGASVLADLALAQEAMNQDKHIRHIDRIELVRGDVEKTVPEFAAARGDGLRIALLNLDLDLYRPTLTALEHFVPKMVRGGIIVVDEYAVEAWGGESRAVDDYFTALLGRRPKIEKLTWHSNPSAYIEVDW